MGARDPGMLSTVKEFMAEEVLPMGAGAKAAAEPARRVAMASFIILLREVESVGRR